MTLIFPRMPHYTATHRAHPSALSLIRAVAEYSEVFRKRRSHSPNMKYASVFVYLMDERFLLRALEMPRSSRNLCSLHSVALTSPQLLSYAHDFFIPEVLKN